jgi:hypothetical protein
MEAYEIYWHDKNGEDHFIGILPERRKNPERITLESVLDWGRKVVGEDTEVKDIFFTKVILEENMGAMSWAKSSVTSKEAPRK